MGKAPTPRCALGSLSRAHQCPGALLGQNNLESPARVPDAVLCPVSEWLLGNRSLGLWGMCPSGWRLAECGVHISCPEARRTLGVAWEFGTQTVCGGCVDFLFRGLISNTHCLWGSSSGSAFVRPLPHSDLGRPHRRPPRDLCRVVSVATGAAARWLLQWGLRYSLIDSRCFIRSTPTRVYGCVSAPGTTAVPRTRPWPQAVSQLLGRPGTHKVGAALK